MANPTVRQGILKRVGPVGCAAAAVGLLLSMLLLIAGGWWMRAANRIQAGTAEIHARGEPADAAAIEALYRRPPKDLDCTDLWQFAVADFAAPPFYTATRGVPFVDTAVEPPPPGEDWPDLPAAEALLRRYAAELAQMHRAAARGGAARYPTAFREGAGMMVPHVHPLWGGAQMLALEAQVRAHAGDATGAAESIHAIFALAGSLENEPLGVSQSMRMRFDGIGWEQIQRLLPTVEFAEDDLRRFQDHLRTANYERNWHNVLLAERVMGIIAFREPETAMISETKGAVWRIAQAGDQALFLDMQNRLVAASGVSWSKLRNEAVAIDREMANLAAVPAWQRDAHAVSREFVARCLASVDYLGRACARNEAADAALAVELFQRKQGRLPAGLDELVPELLPSLPVDRFDPALPAAPLRFVASAGEWIVYSVGPDAADDGGDDFVESAGQGSADVVVRVRLRPDSPPATQAAPR